MSTPSNRSRVKAILDRMTDEVNDLHPVLKIMLSNMPGVLECEYTHGSDEWGADFVLTVEDTILGGIVHVGVIAKRGAIKQDLRQIDTQIEECRLVKRKVGGGMKEIELNRIWIIASGSVSKNAKTKLHEKYRATGISIIDGSKLVDLMLKHAPYIEEDVTPEIVEYLKEMQRRTEIRRHQRDMLGIDGDVPEIDLDIVELKRNPDGRAKQETIKLDEAAEVGKQIIVLEGRAGAGKTRALEKLAMKYATPAEYKRTGKIPVLLSVRDLRERYDWNVDGAIEGEIGKSACMRLREENSGILMLLDGFDEIPEDDNKKRNIIRDLHEQIQNTWPEYGVVITTRTGEEWVLDRTGGIRELLIKAVSLKKMIAFVINTCNQVQLPQRMAEDLRRSDLFRQLPQNPIAAILLSKIIREEGKELPSSLTEIYSKATELMLGRWDQQKGIVHEHEYLIVRNVMERIAKNMIDNDMWEISRSWIEDEFSRYIDERRLKISKEKVTQQALRRTGLLVEHNDRGTVEFKHVSFMEFLYASGWEPSSSERNKKMYAPGWAEIYFFYIGLKRNSEDILEEALLHKEDDFRGRWRKVLAAPSYMMAGWTAPYRIVEKNLGALIIEAANIFLALRNGSLSKVAENLTEVQLLYVVQAIMREQYSYNHFKDAIDTAVLDILEWKEQPGNQEAGYFALALAAFIGNDIGEDEPLRILVEENRITRLPPALSLGLDMEGRTETSTTDRLKKLFQIHRRRLSRVLNRDFGLRDYIRNQALVPIKIVRNRKKRNKDEPS